MTVNSTVWATGWRFEDTEDYKPFTSKSPSFHLDTEVGIDVNRTFCIKTKDIISEEAGEWPQGNCKKTTAKNCKKVKTSEDADFVRPHPSP